ncbi:MAG TPA: hypothetical protein VFW23_15905, partial [Tepidisphaeraceae bacterium]|nr:hypothetical protein [Tepidisphaeraceae bacterium]
MTRQFGQFEAVAQLHAGPFGSLFKARYSRRRGDYAVKYFNPDPVLANPDQIKQALADFVERGQLERRLVAEGATHWVRVHEMVSGEGGYRVLDYYPQTARTLIQNHAELTGLELHSIISGFVVGLVELKKIAGRAHGNLKPENVLLNRRKRRGAYTVALVDAAASWQLGAAGDAERRDLCAVGNLIHDLVIPDPRSVHHAGPSPRWEALGPVGESWRSLCNDLIADDADRLLANLDELQSRVTHLGHHHVGSESSNKGVLVAVAVIIILAGGLALAYPFLGKHVKLPWIARGDEKHTVPATLPVNRATTRQQDSQNNTPATQPITINLPEHLSSQPTTEMAATQPSGDSNASTRPVVVADTRPVQTTRPVLVADSQPVLTTQAADTQPIATTRPIEVATTQPIVMPDPIVQQRKELSDSATAVRVLLDQGYSVADPTNDSSLNDAVERYRKSRVPLSANEADGLAGDLDARLRNEQDVAATSDLQKLLDVIGQSKHLDIAMTAWHRISVLPLQPDGNALSQMLAASQQLSPLIDRVVKQDRKAELKNQITASLPALWDRAMQSATTTDAMDRGLDLARQFGVSQSSIDGARTARALKRRAEFLADVDRLYADRAMESAEYSAIKEMANLGHPLAEPNRGRLLKLPADLPGAQTSQRVEAMFPDLAAYRWLMAARAQASRVTTADRSDLFAATTMAMARAGLIRDALYTIEAMESSPTKAQAYVEIAQAQAAARQIGPANQTLSRAMGIASLIRDAGGRAKVLASIAEAQSRMGRSSDAMATLARAKSSLEELPDSDSKTDALIIVCGAQARLGDYSAAYATASPLKASPARADEAARVIICAQADANQIDQAQTGLSNIKLPQEQSLAREHLVLAQIRVAKLDDAMKTADGIETPAPRGRAFAAICEAYVHAGNASKASSAMESAVSNLGVGDQSHRWELYPQIARVQAALGKVADARATADQIEDLPTKASAWCLVALEQSRAGGAAGAAKSLQSAASSIANASGPHRVGALAQIANAQVRLNDPASANATLDLARSAATASANAQEDDRALIEAEVQAGAWD